MNSSKDGHKQHMIVGIEFEKLTHWERYTLNQNLVKMERELFPDADPAVETNDEDDLWRGERRNFHRLSIRKLGIRVMIDLSTTRGGIFRDVLLLNLSPAGCCVQIATESDLQPGSRIPRLCIPLEDDKLVLRARVVHVANNSPTLDADCTSRSEIA
ncbi:PilZ domain-containing protein [bacterium]|nr:PilZ domain-containing protein [candidate division CSSED10-310 bacterium]